MSISNYVTIWFVCLGNTCRSPVGEALTRFKLAKLNINAIVRSCGLIDAFQGVEKANANSICLLRLHFGIDILNHRRTFAGKVDFSQADHIFVVDAAVKQELVEKYSAPANQIHILCEATGGIPNPYVDDRTADDQPYGPYAKMVATMDIETEKIATEIATFLRDKSKTTVATS